jgi:hypothetical protein
MARPQTALRLSPLLIALTLTPAWAQQSGFDPSGIDPALAEGIGLCYNMLLDTKHTVGGLAGDGWTVSTYGDEPYYSDVSGDRSADSGPSESLFLGMEQYPAGAKIHYCTLDVTDSSRPSLDGLSNAFGSGIYEQDNDGTYAIWDDNGLLGRLTASDDGYFVQVTQVEGN